MVFSTASVLFYGVRSGNRGKTARRREEESQDFHPEETGVHLGSPGFQAHSLSPDEEEWQVYGALILLSVLSHIILFTAQEPC